MTLEDPTQNLIAKAQAGDRAAFDALARQYSGRLEALIRSRMGRYRMSDNDLADVRQEVLMRSFKAVDRFRWQGDDSFMRWLGAIAENVILNSVKKLSRHKVLQLDRSIASDGEPLSKVLRRNERFERLEKSLNRLSEDYRTVILLARIDGLSTREIAGRMNRSESSVKNLLLRALKALREAFGDTESLGLPHRELRVEEDGDVV